MAFTSLGIGSGVDLNTMLTQLVALERAPLTQMQKVATKLQTQVSSFGKIQSLFSTLQDASNKLTGNALWSQGVANSADTNTVSVSGGAGAPAGSYSVLVERLAGNQTLSSSATFGAATDLVGSGTLTFERGTWDGSNSSFTAASGSPVSIQITATDTLTTLRDKINGAGTGVTATLVTDANGVRLSMRSTDSGAANGFRINATDGDGSNTDNGGISRFAFDPPNGTTGMDFKLAASNAKARVNGIEVESATNDLDGVVEGLTIRLRKESTTPVDVSITRDTEAVSNAIKSFADAYNQLVKYIGEQTKYDAASKVGGPLQGDSAVGSLQSQLRAILATTSGASAAFPRLSDVGLQVMRDGTLSVDSSKLSSAIGKLDELKKAFANNDLTGTANDGFARRYAELATRMLGVDGGITTRTEGLRTLIKKNGDDQTKLNERVDRFQARMVAQYTQMDTNLSKLNALSSYVSQQLAVLNASNG